MGLPIELYFGDREATKKVGKPKMKLPPNNSLRERPVWDFGNA